MSERLYACLLRLYPSRFRAAYGEEALQLVRDRFRHERGFLQSLRLWWDLLADCAVSVPREYRDLSPGLFSSPLPHPPSVAPAFHLLASEAPHPGALALGGLLVALAVSAMSMSARYSPNSPPAPSSLARNQPPSASGATAQPRRDASKLDPAERRRILNAVTATLKEHYIDPELARIMADALREHEKNHDYDAAADSSTFAAMVTSQLRDLSHDPHLVLVYSPETLPAPPTSPSRPAARQQPDCAFEEPRMLPHNIGYLKFNWFPDLSACQPAITSSMVLLNRAAVIILDLRDNRGGYPDTVRFLASYLFDRPEYLYNPRENTSQRSWTQSPVPGSTLAGKPVYLLTSTRTASAAEQFSYDLKMLKRATLIGETTSGSAHAGVFHRIDDHFGMGISETKAINPFGKTDWDGVGVEPDVKVKAADALAEALRLAGKGRRK